MSNVPRTSAEIRESFLSFFEEKGSKRVASSSIVPDDPSMLLTSAGMVQFKPYFLGKAKFDGIGATSCQKCIRTTDIDVIGLDARHLSFFEMLGNFSFGGYGKKEACAWAFEYITEHLELPLDNLYFSIYEDDDEAHDIWVELGVPEDRIVRLGAEDNFWTAGPTGPCGPSSEIYFDQGPGKYPCDNPDECAPGCECDRFLEFWNLVFTQFDRQEDGSYKKLPKVNIDTGMGLERMAAIMQGAHSNYETDILFDLIQVIEKLSNKKYGVNAQDDTSIRIIVDHARAITFMVSDGVLPSNEGRGYVLRRLLRRAARHGHLLGIDGAFLAHPIKETMNVMGDAYPEIREREDLILGIVQAEENRFLETLHTGSAYLKDAIKGLQPGEMIDGKTAFVLHDTYGFPIDLTEDFALENDLSVDVEGFEKCMSEQRERARSQVKDVSWEMYGSPWVAIANEQKATAFVGDDHNSYETTVVALVSNGEEVSSVTKGQKAEILLEATPFYGEMGGQVGDRGIIENDKAKLIVTDTQVHGSKLIISDVIVDEGTISVGDTVTATIDVMRREYTRRNHTATHILHWALRQTLGEHVTQAGSLVTPEYLRFDFTHFEGLTSQEVCEVENLINQKILEAIPTKHYETTLDKAKADGVIALFGEKYSNEVKVLEIGDFSKELCGGTHVRNTSEIGLIKILSEGSVGANVRRIEAITSKKALEFYQNVESNLELSAAKLKVNPKDLPTKIENLLGEEDKLKKEVKHLKDIALAGGGSPLNQLIDNADTTHGYPLVVEKVEGFDNSSIRELWDQIKQKLPGSAAVLASVNEGGAPVLLAAGTDEAIDAGFNANAVIKHIVKHIHGGGGGGPALAQAGGSNADGIEPALDEARQFLNIS